MQSWAGARGVLAGFVNDISSGSILATLIAAVNSYGGVCRGNGFYLYPAQFIDESGGWVFLFSMYTVVPGGFSGRPCV